LGDFNTITGGFTGGGTTKSDRKRCVHSIMTVAIVTPVIATSSLAFTEENFRDVVSHEDDPMVLSTRCPVSDATSVVE